MRYFMVAIMLFAISAQAAPQAHAQPEAPKAKNPAFALAQQGDWVQGNPNSKVTVTEYASLSCPHCAVFYQKVFGDLQKNYIATGKIQFIYRDFPLNAPALRAAMVARCMPEDKRAALVDKLFKDQNSWAFTSDFEIHLETIAVDQGMSKKEFKKCVADKAVEEAVVKGRMDATQQLAIGGTPSLFINGVLYKGGPDAKEFEAEIEKVLSSK